MRECERCEGRGRVERFSCSHRCDCGGCTVEIDCDACHGTGSIIVACLDCGVELTDDEIARNVREDGDDTCTRCLSAYERPGLANASVASFGESEVA